MTRHASDLKHCRAHQVNIYFTGLPAIEETLMMMPPSFPCSRLMCSSAKYVPLITDVYTEKNGQSSCADKDRKHLLFTCMCIHTHAHTHTHVTFIYSHVYDTLSTLIRWFVIIIVMGRRLYLTRLTSMVLPQFFSLLMPALLITMSRWPKVSTVSWKASDQKKPHHSDKEKNLHWCYAFKRTNNGNSSYRSSLHPDFI